MDKTVLVPIADGIEDIEFACIVDVLRRANADVTVASVGSLDITASRGLSITADVRIEDCKGRTYDLIALPGGLPGADNLCGSETLKQLLIDQKRSGRFYAAICASPAVVFEHHKLIDDVRATCYPSLLEKLSNPASPEERIVIDSNCVTGQGPGTAIEFGLKLVELLFGTAKAKQIADGLLVSY